MYFFTNVQWPVSVMDWVFVIWKSKSGSCSNFIHSLLYNFTSFIFTDFFWFFLPNQKCYQIFGLLDTIQLQHDLVETCGTKIRFVDSSSFEGVYKIVPSNANLASEPSLLHQISITQICIARVQHAQKQTCTHTDKPMPIKWLNRLQRLVVYIYLKIRSKWTADFPLAACMFAVPDSK